MKRTRALIASALTATLAITACESSSKRPPPECAAHESTAGQWTVECDDGTSISARDGSPGAPGRDCTASAGDDGAVELTCDDGTRIIVDPPQSGSDGRSCSVSGGGPDPIVVSCTDGFTATIEGGTAGADGLSCNVAVDPQGALFSCDDGSTVYVRDGNDGADGMSCAVASEAGGATVTCSDGSVAHVPSPSDGATCSVVDNDDGTATITCTDGSTSIVPLVSGCVAGAWQWRECGYCGRQERTCGQDRAWSTWSVCDATGDCAAGTTESEACGADTGACTPGTRSRTCTARCEWLPWSTCGGALVSPSIEVCGNGADDDCDGETDERCECNPVAPGQSGSIETDAVGEVAAHPTACLAFGLSRDESELIRFDTAAKTELGRLPLSDIGTSVDISRDGTAGLVAIPSTNEVVVFSPDTFAVLKTIDIFTDLGASSYDDLTDARFEANPDGDVVLIATEDVRGLYRYRRSTQEVTVLPAPRVDGSLLAVLSHFRLSPLGDAVYAMNRWSSGTRLFQVGLAESELTPIGRSPRETPFPDRHIIVSPSRVYWDGRRYDAANVQRLTGVIDDITLAATPDDRIVVGAAAIYDAETLRRLGVTPGDRTSALFPRSEAEVWLFDGETGDVLYTHLSQHLYDGRLGGRRTLPQPLPTYELVTMVHDRARRLIYAADPEQGVIIAINTDTRVPVAALELESAPLSLAISPDGETLYVGFRDRYGVARIALPAFDLVDFAPGHREGIQLGAIAGGRVVAAPWEFWQDISILTPATGAIDTTSVTPSSWYLAAVDASADGRVVYIGQSLVSTHRLCRYGVAPDGVITSSECISPYAPGGITAARSVLVRPDGAGAFYDGRYFPAGSDVPEWSLEELPSNTKRETAVAISPDGAFVASSRHVYRTRDGAVVSSLSGDGAVKVFGLDSRRLYSFEGGVLSVITVTADE